MLEEKGGACGFHLLGVGANRMAMFKYVKRGVKRKHQIIEGILPMLEMIARIKGVKKVIPGEISYSPRRRIRGPSLKLTRPTPTGFKLLAQSGGSIQEVFIVVSGSKEEVRRSLRSLGVK